MAVKFWGIDLSEDECQRILAELQVPTFSGADGGQVVRAVERVLGEVTETDETSLEMKLDRFFAETGAVAESQSTSPKIRLKQDFFHAASIDSLKPAFNVVRPIPQIVIYDEVLATYNEESPGGHACIVQKLDSTARFVYVIDPNVQARRKPTYYSFEDFERGWGAFDQSTCMIFPPDLYHTVRSAVGTSRLGARL